MGMSKAFGRERASGRHQLRGNIRLFCREHVICGILREFPKH